MDTLVKNEQIQLTAEHLQEIFSMIPRFLAEQDSDNWRETKDGIWDVNWSVDDDDPKPAIVSLIAYPTHMRTDGTSETDTSAPVILFRLPESVFNKPTKFTVRHGGALAVVEGNKSLNKAEYDNLYDALKYAHVWMGHESPLKFNPLDSDIAETLYTQGFITKSGWILRIEVS